MKEFTQTNPTDSSSLQTRSYSSVDDVRDQLSASESAFGEWKQTSFSHRSQLFTTLAELLESRKEPLARLMATEMGKPVSSGISEAEKCAWVCRYYAQHAEEFLKPEPVESDAAESFIAYSPLGPLLAIMPWNFPFWQVFRFAAPSLMAGNTVLLSHSDNTTGCGLEIADLFAEAGFPPDVFQTLVIDHDTAEQVIRHPAVKAVSLTGSTQAGKTVAAIAGSELKKVVLELGGSDPVVVLADADPKVAAEICVQSRMINNGQSCIAAKRWIVAKEIHDAFVQEAQQLMSEYKMGNPLNEDTKLGPLAREDLRDQLHKQVITSIEKGATCLCGGTVPDREGFFYPATLLVDVQKGQPAADEELFGPVAAVLKADSEEHALNLANDTEYGLGACVVTADVSKGKALAEHRLDAGCCFVNAFVKSDPRLPFGGIKQSGYGRELSRMGILEFVNAKTVYVA